MNNILVTVDKKLVQEQINKLYRYLAKADAVSVDNTYSEIYMAQNVLILARGAFTVLWGLKLLTNWMDLEDCINRIEAKHNEILEQKKRALRSGNSSKAKRNNILNELYH